MDFIVRDGRANGGQQSYAYNHVFMMQMVKMVKQWQGYVEVILMNFLLW